MAGVMILAGGLLLLLGWLACWWQAGQRAPQGWLLGAVPPLALWLGLRNWREGWLAVLLFLAGLLMLLAGGGWLARHSPERFQQLLGFDWLRTQQEHADQSLQGEIGGLRFEYQNALLDGDVLVLREGSDFFADREIRIGLGNRLQDRDAGLTLDIHPSDTRNLPQIELFWLDGEGQPSGRSLTQDYSLRLHLPPAGQGLREGQLQLSLPASFNTRVLGRFVLDDEPAVTSLSLTPEAEELAKLEALAAELAQKHRPSASSAPDGEAMARPATDQAGDTAAVQPAAQTQAQTQPHIQAQGRAAVVDAGRADTAVAPVVTATAASVADTPGRVLAAGAVRESQVSPASRKRTGPQRLSPDALRSNPAAYKGRQLYVEGKSGKKIQGELQGLNREGQLVLRHTIKGAGYAVFEIHPDDISRVEVR